MEMFGDVPSCGLADIGSNMPMKIIGKPTFILPIHTASCHSKM